MYHFRYTIISAALLLLPAALLGWPKYRKQAEISATNNIPQRVLSSPKWRSRGSRLTAECVKPLLCQAILLLADDLYVYTSRAHRLLLCVVSDRELASQHKPDHLLQTNCWCCQNAVNKNAINFDYDIHLTHTLLHATACCLNMSLSPCPPQPPRQRQQRQQPQQMLGSPACECLRWEERGLVRMCRGS